MTASPANLPLTTHTPRRSRRGFAGMDPQRLREVAQAGGRAAHVMGTAHEFTPDEARLAGLKSQSLRNASGAGADPAQLEAR